MDFIRRHKLLVGFCVVLLVVAMVVFSVLRKEKAAYSNFLPIKKGSIVEAVYGIGTVTPWNTYQLKVGISSTLRAIYVKEGDFVKKGDKLVEIEGLPVFVAPFSGTVTSLPNKVGDAVFPQAPVLVLTNFSNLYLVASIEQDGALRIKQGQQVKISFESMRDKVFNGEVDAVYSFGGRFLARIRTSELPPAVLPDMTADVSIVIRTLDNVLLVPVKALKLDKVKVKRNDYQNPVEVNLKLGVVAAEVAQVLSGDLNEGDQVLVPKEK